MCYHRSTVVPQKVIEAHLHMYWNLFEFETGDLLSLQVFQTFKIFNWLYVHVLLTKQPGKQICVSGTAVKLQKCNSFIGYCN